MNESAPPSVAATEDEDFDLNAEELPDELTPEASALEPEESLETEDEADADPQDDVWHFQHTLSSFARQFHGTIS